LGDGSVRNFDYSDATEFLESFYAGTEHNVELRALANDGNGRPGIMFTRDLPLVVDFCTRWDCPGRGTYFAVATRRRDASNGKRESLAELPGVWVEIDGYKHGLTTEACVQALLACPLKPTCIVFSGRGVHAYWLFREPLDVRLPTSGPDTIKEEVEAVLRQFCGVFCGDPNAIDITRVMRLVGTHNTREGDLRPVRVLDASGVRYELSDLVEMLDWLRPMLRAPAASAAAVVKGSMGTAVDPYLDFAKRFSFKTPIDVQQRLTAMTYGAPDETAIHPTRCSVSSSLVAQGVDDDQIFELLLAATRRAAGPVGQNWNWKREEKLIRKEIETAKAKYAPADRPGGASQSAAAASTRVIQLRPRQQPDDAPAEPEDAPKLAGFPLNDLGNAMRLITQHSAALRYVIGIGWHVWDGRRYEFDPAMIAARRLAHETARTMLLQTFGQPARTKEQAEARKTLIKFAISSGNANKIAGMLSQAEPHLAVAADDLDREPWPLNCLSGTIDLRTGAMQPHAQADLLTKLVPVGYDPTAVCPTWLRFLSEIFAGDEAMIAFVQRALGYSLSGSTREQVIFILHGGGANGKSVLLEVIAALLSDYASHCPAKTFVSDEIGGSGIPNDVARLAGARFVSIVETEHNKKLAEGLVKQATGGDKLTARFMRQEFFEFTPRFKIWLATNHKPRIRGTDNAIWRRIRLLPFNVTFVDKDGALPGQPVKDLDLKDKLLAELPGILNWVIAGCMAWQNDGGLKPPVAVSEATKEYRESQDIVAGFVDDRCNVDPGIECASGELYDAYKKWCVENGERTISSSEFGASLSEKGYITRKGTHGIRMRKGLNLRPIYDGVEEVKGQQY
jgi:putative DNA primase/helicase